MIITMPSNLFAARCIPGDDLFIVIMPNRNPPTWVQELLVPCSEVTM